jgi:hypothetical protein
MSWVVKAWKPELLQAAEREARRLRRAAGREADDAAAYLLVLEDLGTQLREDVRRRRRAQEPRPLPIPEKRPAAATPPPPAPEPAPEPQARPAEIRATPSRPPRASLRDSPLSELFRATG